MIQHPDDADPRKCSVFAWSWALTSETMHQPQDVIAYADKLTGYADRLQVLAALARRKVSRFIRSLRFSSPGSFDGHAVGPWSGAKRRAGPVNGEGPPVRRGRTGGPSCGERIAQLAPMAGSLMLGLPVSVWPAMRRR